MKAFKAYDIRGIYNKDFNKHDAYKIGFFLPGLMKTNEILVGRDGRLSSDEIFEYLSRGICDAGANVHNLGLTTTPMVYFATAQLKFDASVQITASHNSKEYNGMKISAAGAMPVGYDTGLNQLEAMVESQTPLPVKSKGSVIPVDIKTDYLAFLSSFKSDISNLKVVIDCSNGMSALLINDVFAPQVHKIFDNIDGSFPNHEPNPLVESNTESLKQAVKNEHADIGVIFDGDADRVMFIDDKARFVPPDLIIAVLGEYFITALGEKAKGQDVVVDIRTSKSVSERLLLLGYKPNLWKVGRAFAAHKLKELDALFGGELAGHYYFKQFNYSDSGFLASLLVLNVVSQLKNQGIAFSDFVDQIKTYANSGELNYRIERKQEAMDLLKNHFTAIESPVSFYDIDGYRIEFKDWWFNVRASNTEPYLRLLVEAANHELLKKWVEQIEVLLKQFQ